MELVRGGLGERLDRHHIYVDVLRQVDGEGNAAGDVVGDEGPIDPLVHRIGSLLVPVEAGQGETFGMHHSGSDVEDPNVAADEFEAQGGRDNRGGVLGGDISGAALIDDLYSALNGSHLSRGEALKLEARNQYPVATSESMKKGVERFNKGERFWNF